MASLRTRRIGFLGFQQVAALDLFGPMEVFSTANELAAGRRYELILLGLHKRPFVAESGIPILPQASLADCPALDTLLIAGGRGLREPAQLRSASRWLREHQRSIRRIVSVCTGIYALAEAGLLDGLAVTTHWRHADVVAMRYPAVRMDADSIFVKQGRFYTSAGITAGIDLALALVEEDLGPKAALAVARELVVYLKRAGGQRQYSQRLSVQGGATGRLADLSAWVLEHLAEDLSVARLAERCLISPRQLARRFRIAFGESPAMFVEKLRIEEASQRLLADGAPVERIAQAVGFRSADVFRRAFERQFGVAPSEYRARFNSSAAL